MVRNIKDEGTFDESKKGLLIGAIQLKQGNRTLTPSGLGGSERLHIRNVRTGGDIFYEWVNEEDEFFLPLPAGEYQLISITAYNVNANRTPDAQPPPYLIKLFNMEIGKIKTTGGGRFEVGLPSSFFKVIPREAIYVGGLITDLPDPLPEDHFKPKFQVADEEDRIISELKVRFPGIRFLKRLLANSDPP